MRIWNFKTESDLIRYFNDFSKLILTRQQGQPGALTDVSIEEEPARVIHFKNGDVHFVIEGTRPELSANLYIHPNF